MTPPRGVGDAAPYNDLARLLLTVNGHGGLGAGRPTSPFSTVRRGRACPARGLAIAARFRVIPHKKAGVRTLALPCRSSYCNILISPPAAPPARPFPRRCGSPPRRKFRRRGLPAHRGRSPRRGGRVRVEFLAKTSATALPCRSFGSTPSLCSRLYSSATSRMCRISSGVMPPSFSRCFIRISPVRCAKSPARRPRRPPSGSAAAADAGGSWRSAPADPPSRRRRGRRRP